MMLTGGRLALTGNWAQLYNLGSFVDAYNQATGLVLRTGGAVFPYPPPTALALAPFSILRVSLALHVWLITSIAALLIGSRLISGAWTLFPIALLTTPAYVTMDLGQNTMFSFLVLALALVSYRRDHRLLGGAALGILVFKPQLAIGFVLWWLVNPRLYRREVAGAALVSASVIVGSLFLALDGWRDYISSVAELFQPPGMVPLGSFSLLDFVRFLLPGRGTLAMALVGFGMAGMVWAFVALFRRWESDLEIGFALAVVASILLSPHLVVYDWLLLLVPGAILWQRLPDLRPQLTFAGGLLSLAALLSADVVSRSLAVGGSAFSPAFPVLVLLGSWLVVRTGGLTHPAGERQSS